MRIIDIMSEDLILPNLRATAKEPALQELVEHIAVVRPELDAARAGELLRARERTGSTGIGGGIAVPHAKLSGLQAPIACLARSRDGVDFGSLDGEPTHIFLALLAPENSSLYLKALARATRLLKDLEFRAKILEEERAEGLWTLIQEKDEALTSS